MLGCWGGYSAGMSQIWLGLCRKPRNQFWVLRKVLFQDNLTVLVTSELNCVVEILSLGFQNQHVTMMAERWNLPFVSFIFSTHGLLKLYRWLERKRIFNVGQLQRRSVWEVGGCLLILLKSSLRICTVWALAVPFHSPYSGSHTWQSKSLAWHLATIFLNDPELSGGFSPTFVNRGLKMTENVTKSSSSLLNWS